MGKCNVMYWVPISNKYIIKILQRNKKILIFVLKVATYLVTCIQNPPPSLKPGLIFYFTLHCTVYLDSAPLCTLELPVPCNVIHV